MKTALILTTINVPRVLSLYRAFDPSVRFFVVCDEKTPAEAYEFCGSIPDCEVYSPARQKELGWGCSSLLGWNTIARRNIALLEALKWGADIIVSVDDDNIPLNCTCFYDFFHCITESFSGLSVKTDSGWFDPASLQFPLGGPPVCQRGFPQHLSSRNSFAPIVAARVGVAQGMVLGDPDTSAIDRISRHPEVHQVSELLRAGIVSDPRVSWAPLNSQNIAFVCELAPCFLMVPQFGRYDDIFAGLVAQRVMCELGYVVHYGQPFVWQQRNSHNLLGDLRAEQWGAENITNFVRVLDEFVYFPKTDVFEMVKHAYSGLSLLGSMPDGVTELGEAWITDCARALGK